MAQFCLHSTLQGSNKYLAAPGLQIQTLNGTQHNTKQRSSTQPQQSSRHNNTHRLQTHTQCMCFCVSWVVSRCFLAGVWWEATHGERRGHPDEAWRRKNEMSVGIVMVKLSNPPPFTPLSLLGMTADRIQTSFSAYWKKKMFDQKLIICSLDMYLCFCRL